MLKHIVMWKFKDEALGNDKDSNIREAKRMIESLKGRIESIRDIELGINVEGLTGSYDLVLYSAFDDAEGLNAYQTHPEHVEIIAFMKAATAERACVDYEI